MSSGGLRILSGALALPWAGGGWWLVVAVTKKKKKN